MDDAKIDLIAREVLTALKKTRAQEEPPHSHLPASPRTAAGVPLHPSMNLLSVPGGVVGSPCIIEPDKPCVRSGRCRTFGH